MTPTLTSPVRPLGEDTKAFNNPETCRRHIWPGPAVPAPGFDLSFVRRMAAKCRMQQGV